MESNTEWTPFEALLRGPSKKTLSSRDLKWNGLLLEGHTAPPGERPEAMSKDYILGLWGGQPAIGEHAAHPGRFVKYLKPPGSIVVIPPGGILPGVFAQNQVNLTLCGFELGFLQRIQNELDRRPVHKPEYRQALHHVTIRKLIEVLRAEVTKGGPSGRLYIDHLSYALAIRFLHLDSGTEQSSRLTSPLPHHILRRVLERMQDLNADLDLQTLASEAGYSRRHFLILPSRLDGLSWMADRNFPAVINLAAERRYLGGLDASKAQTVREAKFAEINFRLHRAGGIIWRKGSP
jgi:AraC family transcriptional regulator